MAAIPFILALTLRNKILAGDIINHSELEKQRFIETSFEEIENIVLNGRTDMVEFNISSEINSSVRIDTSCRKVFSLNYDNKTLTINYDFDLDTTRNKLLAKHYRVNYTSRENEISEFYPEKYYINIDISQLKNLVTNSGIVNLYLDSTNKETVIESVNSTINIFTQYYNNDDNYNNTPLENNTGITYNRVKVNKLTVINDNSTIDFSNNLFADKIYLNLTNYSKVQFSGIEYNSCEITRDTSSGGQIDLKDLPKMKINVIE